MISLQVKTEPMRSCIWSRGHLSVDEIEAGFKVPPRAVQHGAACTVPPRREHGTGGSRTQTPSPPCDHVAVPSRVSRGGIVPCRAVPWPFFVFFASFFSFWVPEASRVETPLPPLLFIWLFCPLALCFEEI